MLHGGLGCTTTWRDLPPAIAETTGSAVLSYDRWGYGGSDPLTGGRERSYRFDEAGPVFGEVLRHFGMTSVVLFGHSDGGAMSLLAAAAHPQAVRAVCACSPTISLDLHMVRGMAAAREAFERGGLRERLMRHHGDKTDAMFWGWHVPWSTADAIRWSMAEQLADVRCPVAALFGQPLRLATQCRGTGHTWQHAPGSHGAGRRRTYPQHKARYLVLSALRRLLRAVNSDPG